LFSKRTPASHAANLLTLAAGRRRGDLVDLTVSNPTAVGLDPPPGLGALASAANGLYDPDPHGGMAARRAVSGYYAERGVEAPPERLVLTASSSEAYSWLFKVLCDPGDAILVPAPSYPLLDSLAELETVELARYRLPPEDGWAVHSGAVAERADRLAAAGKRVKAVVLVNPNNPTGTSIAADELGRLEETALRRGFAILSDEVFLDYRFADRNGDVRVAASRGHALVFSLGGLSKAAALPQMKLGWILANGPPELLAGALERLEWVADSFLSVGTPVQNALPALLGGSGESASAIRARVLRNDGQLRSAFPAGGAVDVLPLRAGWTAVLRVPAVVPETDLAVALVERHGVLVHPGYFFDFPHEAFLVLSLLPSPDLFDQGIERLRGGLGALCQ
jgi:aspartate/methionine/tyrosine aminotransferase